jgi:hypothetical protein
VAASTAEPAWAETVVTVTGSLYGVGGVLMLPALLYHSTAAPAILGESFRESWPYWAFLTGGALWVGTGVALCYGFLAHRRWARYLAVAINAAALLHLARGWIGSLVTGRWNTSWAGTVIHVAIGLYCAAVLALCLSRPGRRLLARRR